MTISTNCTEKFTPMPAPAQATPTGLFDDNELMFALLEACRLDVWCLTKEESRRRTNAETDAWGDAWDAFLDLLASRMGYPGLLIRPGKWSKEQSKRLMDLDLFGLSAACCRAYGEMHKTGDASEWDCCLLALDNRLWEALPRGAALEASGMRRAA